MGEFGSPLKIEVRSQAASSKIERVAVVVLLRSSLPSEVMSRFARLICYPCTPPLDQCSGPHYSSSLKSISEYLMMKMLAIHMCLLSWAMFSNKMEFVLLTSIK